MMARDGSVMRGRTLVIATSVWFVLAGSNSGTAAAAGEPKVEAAKAAIQLTASPSPIVAGPCTGCGQASTDLEAATALTIKETGGVGRTVTAIAVELREDGTDAVIASGEFSGDSVKFFAETNRLSAGGSLVARNIGVHFGRDAAASAATLTYTVRVTDDHGVESSTSLSVPVRGSGVPTPPSTP